MPQRPKVSVLTPAYNVAPYIGQCIESVQAQTLTDWEMIIVDDASTDDTVQVVQRYLSDPRIRLLQNERNSGAASARNRALDVARGEWIAVLDADDWYAPTRLEKLVSFAEQMEADMVADLQVYCTAWGSVYTVAWATHAKPPRHPRYYTAEEVIRAHPAFKPVIRTEFLRSTGVRYAETLRQSEDYAFCIEVLLKGGRFALLPEPMYHHRVLPRTLTTRYDPLQENQRVLGYLLSLPEVTPPMQALLRAAFKRRAVYDTYPRFARALKQGQLGQAWQLARAYPGVWLLLLRELPLALYRRLFAREQLVDPWREASARRT
ncbi:MAG: glycosyltransferase family 2 protein [Armatimonadota bacterium]|nr:glycosyltransferase family 2 protein [Armatimonadota bacterium]